MAIGRALINHPKLILADEPTAALDKDTGRHVVTMLQKRACATELRNCICHGGFSPATAYPKLLWTG